MTRSARLVIALVLNLLLIVGLAYVGVTAHSLGVLAAGVDYLADAVAIGVAVVAIRLSSRFSKANALAAAVNAGWLFVLSLLVIATGIDRLATRTPAVHGLPVLVMSGIAGVVMIAAALVLGIDFDADDDSDEALSHRAVLLDTAADAASALGVAAAGAIILATGGWDWLDPAVALAIAVVVSWHAYCARRNHRSARVASTLPDRWTAAVTSRTGEIPKTKPPELLIWYTESLRVRNSTSSRECASPGIEPG